MVSQNAYIKYSIDIEPPKKRHVALGFFIKQSKQNYIENHELKKKRRIQQKISRKTQRHTYKIQTKKVRKRMKETKAEAINYNRGKVPLKVIFKRFVN